MAPIKFEEHIKEKLEQRKLQPSPKAWSQLANRLDAKEKKQNNPLFWWLGIAASIALLIAVALPFFNNNKDQAQPIIVDTAIDTLQQKNEQKATPLKETLKIIETPKANNTVVKTEVPKVPITIKPKSQEQKVITDQTFINKKAAIADNNGVKTIDQKAIEPALQKTTSFEDLKVQDVVAEIQKLKDTPAGVTDHEIDSLLKVAQKEILNQRLYNETTKTVDAELLLQDVEADLEQSFRIKVFEALKTNYGKVKTAVAERNN